MGLKNFDLGDIALGTNMLQDVYSQRPGESPSIQNFLPGAGGHWVQRRDGLTFMATMPAATRVQNIYEWPLKNFLILAQDNDIFSGPRSVSTVWTKRFDSVQTGHKPWCFELAKDGAGNEMLWGVNGADAPQKWDGVTATTVAWAGGIPPAGCTWIRLWKNRMVAGGNAAFPDRIYYSNIGNPELPNPWNFIDIRSSYDDSDITVWGELLGDNLLVFKKNSTWLVYDSNTFANRRLGFPGVPHENLTANLNGAFYFLSKNRLWLTDGITDPRPVSLKFNIDLIPDDVNSRASQLVADPVNERLLLLLTQTAGTSTPIGWVCYIIYPPKSKNNTREEFTCWRQFFSLDVGFLALVDAVLFAGDPAEPIILSAHKSSARLMQFLTGNTDDGTSIIATWQSSPFRISPDMERIERIRRGLFRCTVPVTVTFSATRSGGMLPVPMSATTYEDVDNFFKLRPEIRGREFTIKLDTVGSNALNLWNIQLEFRGGKEHKQ